MAASRLRLHRPALDSGRPLAGWVTIAGSRRRLTVAPRSDVETGEVYGVAVRLAAELSEAIA